MPTIDGFGDPYAFLSGGGEMGQRMRAHDWAATSLGPLADWPQSLKTMVSTCLNSPVLATVLWGPDLIMLYNDAYIPSLADRHPNAMATPVAHVWGSAWEQVCAPFHHCQRTGEGFSQAEVELPMIRRGKSRRRTGTSVLRRFVARTALSWACSTRARRSLKPFARNASERVSKHSCRP